MSYEISIGSGDPAPILDNQTIRIPQAFTSFGETGPIGIDWVGRPAYADTFGLTEDLGITAIIVGGLAILSLVGVIWAQPYLMATEFGISRAIGGIKAVEKLGADVFKGANKLFK